MEVSRTVKDPVSVGTSLPKFGVSIFLSPAWLGTPLSSMSCSLLAGTTLVGRLRARVAFRYVQ
jgi:hypothetical protein